MVTKTRVPNKTAWSLEDIAALCIEANAKWERAMRLAEKNLDPLMMRELSRLGVDIAEIRRIAAAARRGDYEERHRDGAN